MSEAAVINLFLTVRVCVVGGILLVLPSITRKGLLFGAYVGEAFTDRDEARRLLGSWYLGCVILMAMSLLVGLGISFLAGRPVAGNLTGTAFLLLGALGLYLRFHSRARGLTPPLAALQAEEIRRHAPQLCAAWGRPGQARPWHLSPHESHNFCVHPDQL